METREELEQQLSDLHRGRNTGARVVRYRDGSATEFKSDAEMASAIAALKRRIAALDGASRVSTIRFRTSKGV